MYQALYRKYRPKNLEEIAGQRVITKTITNEIINDKLSHAYLFAGPRGTGKTSIAKIIAKIINCEHPNGIIPCDECVNCTQFNLKQSNDIIEIDAASNNGVDEIRELKSKVNLVPSTGKYKIYIIDEVHMLTVGAFNALLKTLEEPPAHIIFILATTDPHKIPNTILSRCQRFDFEKISEKDIVERLKSITEKENIEITEESLYEIARLSDGGMRDSISMLDQVVSYVDEGTKIEEKDVHEINGTLSQMELKEFIEYVLKYDLENIFVQIDKYNQSGKNIIKLTEEIIMYLRNLLLMKEVPHYFESNNINIEAYKNISGEIQKSQLILMIEELNKSLQEMKKASSPKIILELSLIKMLSESTASDKKSVNGTQNVIFKSTVEKNKDLDVKKVELKGTSIDTTKTIETPAVQVDNSSETNTNSVSEVSPKEEVLTPEQNELHKKLNEIKDRRIENTLATFNKKLLLKFRSMEPEIKSKILDPEYNQTASIILDGELKAAGNNYLVYVYPDVNLANLFNENLVKIERMFEDIFKEHYRLIATDKIEWEEIKNSFNKKLRTYVYQEETFNINEILTSSTAQQADEMKNLFGNIVEYQ